MSLISKIQSLISSANAVTGESRTDLTSAVQDLKDGYGGSTVEKGLVFSEYDSDGYPHKAEFVGSWTSIPESFLAMISTNDFKFMSNITHIDVPEGVTSIGNGAFRNYNSYGLTSISLPSTLTSIGNTGVAMAYCTSLEVPSGVTQLVVDSIANLYRCEQLTFLGDITSVARYAFERTGQNASTLTIDFSHCTGVPTLENANAFAYTPAKIIKVPQSLLSAWQTETNWVGITNVTWQGV